MTNEELLEIRRSATLCVVRRGTQSALNAISDGLRRLGTPVTEDDKFAVDGIKTRAAEIMILMDFLTNKD